MSLSGEQIRARGLAALRRELGRAGLVRFLQHFEPGSGDYTAQRAELLKDLTIDDLRRRVRLKKKKVKQRRA
jgi:hypothetical protein